MLRMQWTAKSASTHHLIIPDPSNYMVRTSSGVLWRYFRMFPNFFLKSFSGSFTLVVRNATPVIKLGQACLIKNSILATSVWNVCVSSSLWYISVLFTSNKWLAAGVGVCYLWFLEISCSTFDRYYGISIPPFPVFYNPSSCPNNHWPFVVESGVRLFAVSFSELRD